MPRLAFAAAGLLAAGLSLQPAAAQRSGFYAVEGRGIDGSVYMGAATLTPTGPQTWRIIWRVGGNTSVGVGLTVGKLLVIGYISDRETGVAAYEVRDDGRLVGRWTQGSEGGVGTETLIPR